MTLFFFYLLWDYCNPQYRVTSIASAFGPPNFQMEITSLVSPTNTNFRLTFLLNQLQEALYEDLAVKSIKFEVYYHFSGL